MPPHLQLMMDPCRHNKTWHRPVRLRFCRQQPRFERLARPRQNPNHEQQRELLTFVARRLLTRHANIPCGNAAQKNRRGHRPQMCVRGSLCAFRALFAKNWGVRDSGSLAPLAAALLDAETVHATVVVRASCTTTSLPNTSKGNPFCFSDCARQ